jgi:hypothetical protein
LIPDKAQYYFAGWTGLHLELKKVIRAETGSRKKPGSRRDSAEVECNRKMFRFSDHVFERALAVEDTDLAGDELPAPSRPASTTGT